MKEHAEFIIDETFGVPGVGTVIAGTVKRGVITTNANLMLGPDVGDGTFKLTAIKSIQYKRLPVTRVCLHSHAAHREQAVRLVTHLKRKYEGTKCVLLAVHERPAWEVLCVLAFALVQCAVVNQIIAEVAVSTKDLALRFCLFNWYCEQAC